MPTGTAMSDRTATTYLAELVEILGFEHRLLEYLLFKLVSANLVLASADRRFVGPAVDEVEQVLGRVRRAEQDRQVVVDRLAEAWGETTPELTLTHIAERSIEPYATELHEARLGFARLVDEIDRVARANRSMATVGLGDLRSAFGIDDGVTYAASGEVARPTGVAVHIERRL